MIAFELRNDLVVGVPALLHAYTAFLDAQTTILVGIVLAEMCNHERLEAEEMIALAEIEYLALINLTVTVRVSHM